VPADKGLTETHRTRFQCEHRLRQAPCRMPTGGPTSAINHPSTTCTGCQCLRRAGSSNSNDACKHYSLTTSHGQWVISHGSEQDCSLLQLMSKVMSMMMNRVFAQKKRIAAGTLRIAAALLVLTAWSCCVLLPLPAALLFVGGAAPAAADSSKASFQS